MMRRVVHELRLCRQQLVARFRRWRFENPVGEVVGCRAFANEHPLVALADVEENPRRRRVRGEWRATGNARRCHTIAGGRHSNADPIAGRKRADNSNLRERIVAALEDILELRRRRPLDLRAPEREIAGDILGLLHGKEPLDRRAQLGIVGALTAMGGRQQHRQRKEEARQPRRRHRSSENRMVIVIRTGTGTPFSSVGV